MLELPGLGESSSIHEHRTSSGTIEEEEIALEHETGNVNENEEEEIGVTKDANGKWKLVPPKGSEKQQEFFERANCLNAPLAVMLALVCGYAWGLDLQVEGTSPFVVPMFAPMESDTVGTAAAKSFAYAGIILCCIIVITYVFVGMFYARMKWTLIVLCGATFMISLMGMPAYVITLYWESDGLDILTLVLFLWNFGLFGTISILFPQEFKIPSFCTKSCLILVAVALSWPFCCLPEWTLWCLILLMVLWDLCAVLTPCGPLRYALYLEQQRRYMGEEMDLPGGMVFDAGLYALGLMDFVFYGIILGRATIIGWPCACACFLAVVAGLIITIVLTPPHTTLPALPITMSVGVIIYFLTKYSLGPFVMEFGKTLNTL